MDNKKALYHFDNNKWMRYIKDNGLVPHNGQNSQSNKDNKKVVFYSQGEEGAVVMYMDFLKHYEDFKGEKGDKAKAKYDDAVAGRIELSEDEMNSLKSQVNEINRIRETDSIEEYVGEGPYLIISEVEDETIDDKHFNFANSWTTKTIPPEKLSVMVLKDKNGGKDLSEKADIIDFFLGKMTKAQVRELPINDKLSDYISNYMDEHQEELTHMHDSYTLESISLDQYISEELEGKLTVKDLKEPIKEGLERQSKKGKVDITKTKDDTTRESDDEER